MNPYGMFLPIKYNSAWMWIPILTRELVGGGIGRFFHYSNIHAAILLYTTTPQRNFKNIYSKSDQSTVLGMAWIALTDGDTGLGVLRAMMERFTYLYVYIIYCSHKCELSVLICASISVIRYSSIYTTLAG